MDSQTVLWIIGGFQAIQLLLLGWIKLDQSDIWKRVYNHYHEIDCANPECKKLKTGNVVIPHEAS